VHVAPNEKTERTGKSNYGSIAVGSLRHFILLLVTLVRWGQRWRAEIPSKQVGSFQRTPGAVSFELYLLGLVLLPLLK
jgi:hypothetical protein